jgi:hypothetical protein
MSCSSCSSCSCSSCTSTATACTEICTALVISNAWNVPACSASAVLSVPGLETLLVGSYLWNPTYGWFRVTAFDSVNFQITVYNECFAANAAAGTVVPAGTQFVFGAPPGATQVYFEASSSVSGAVITALQQALTFPSGTQPIITLTSPGSYYITGAFNYGPNGATTSAPLTINVGVSRLNNTPAAIRYVNGGGFPTVTGAAYIAGVNPIYPFVYTTTNSNDQLTIIANYTGGTVSAGTIVSNHATILAIKLF